MPLILFGALIGFARLVIASPIVGLAFATLGFFLVFTIIQNAFYGAGLVPDSRLKSD